METTNNRFIWEWYKYYMMIDGVKLPNGTGKLIMCNEKGELKNCTFHYFRDTTKPCRYIIEFENHKLTFIGWEYYVILDNSAPKFKREFDSFVDIKKQPEKYEKGEWKMEGQYVIAGDGTIYPLYKGLFLI